MAHFPIITDLDRTLTWFSRDPTSTMRFRRNSPPRGIPTTTPPDSVRSNLIRGAPLNPPKPILDETPNLYIFNLSVVEQANHIIQLSSD
jgi:hypothetical protein